MKLEAGILVALVVSGVCSAGTVSHFNGGRIPPIHRLAPLDVEGDKVSPGAALPEPISQEKTCAQCHDVGAMQGGSHFRTGLTPTNDVEPSVVVEPWFLADEKTGTAIPLSLHGQDGAFTPGEIGLSCWQWTKMFGRSFPGGGIGSDTNALNEVAGDRARWFVTGPLGANCLACHQQSGYDHSEWARQVLRENFAGAATAASGLGVVEGMNERLEGSWDGLRAENPDDHLFKVPEKTIYDLRQFDAKNRCVFNVGKPKSGNCLACHAVSQAGVSSCSIAGDVHLKRGMTCVDCHKNGMDHRVATTGCADCHTGAKGAGPTPKHAGIPLVHFEKLACTVCHSGVTKDGARAQVRTARANRIGIYGRAQWATDTPYIVEPVFVKNAEGKVEPRRMMWPSYFAKVDSGTKATKDAKVANDSNDLKILTPDEVKGLKALSTTNAFSKAVVAAALAELNASADKSSAPIRYAFIGHGKLWQLQGEGTNATLVASAHAAAAPVSWPVGHDVRSARQARGAAPVKCADCHTSDSEFFLGKVMPTGPMVDADVESVAQADFLKVYSCYHTVLGSTFSMRPLLKVFMWTVFGLMCLFVAAAAAVALNKFAQWLSDNTVEFVWGLFKWVVSMGLCVSTAYLALSGVIGWLCGGMTGWWLVLHMVAGGGFASCAVILMAFRAAERTKKTLPGLAWMLLVTFAAGTVFTSVMPMMTVFGSHGQEILLWSHRCVALSFTAVGCLVCWFCCKKK